MVPPLPQREGEAYAMWIAATGEAFIISDEGVRGLSRGLRRSERGFFSLSFPP
jgi:hypothetical protein